MTRAHLLLRLNREIAPFDGLPLQEWIDKVGEILPLEDGIYCGREGRLWEEMKGTYRGSDPDIKGADLHGLYLVMTWYADANSNFPPKVEVAYLS